jgi:hypothetical protein
MYARALEDATTRLRELRHEEREDLGLALLALALALAATQVRPGLAIPLFLGGLAIGMLGVRAVWRRWDLVDRLAADHDAYVIDEVRTYAAREATIDRRRTFATLIRSTVDSPFPVGGGRADVTAELRTLAAELDDDWLDLDPASAIECMRLVSDPVESPLLDPRRSADELRARVRHIRSGFSPHGAPRPPGP